MDFTIFGNEFFSLSGGAISGIFNHPGLTVWVSQDNLTYNELNSSTGADDLYPAEGTGDPGLPVNPAFTPGTFTGETTAQALSLYAGSAGGASYSISSAADSGSDPANLRSISYICVEGSGGFEYVDAFARIVSVPEPTDIDLGAAGILVAAASLRHRKISKGQRECFRSGIFSKVLCAFAHLFKQPQSAFTLATNRLQWGCGLRRSCCEPGDHTDCR